MIAQLLEFIQNHWILVFSLVAVLLFIAFEEIRAKVAGIQKISAQDGVILVNREEGIFLDVRNQAGFRAAHIANSINISKSDLDQQIDKLAIHKNKTIIIVDENGSDAASIGGKLKKHGFDKIRMFARGITSWKEAQLPLQKN